MNIGQAGRRAILPIIALAMTALVITLFWPVADWIAEHDARGVPSAEYADKLRQARDAARGRIIQAGTGLLAIGALIYTGRSFTLTRREAQRQAEVSQKTLRLAEHGQVTGRYTSAIEQLGSDKLDVRIGGIYALERIAGDSERDHATVMEVLSTFVTVHSHEEWNAPYLPGGHVDSDRPRPDVQAAVTVIARRDPDRDLESIDLIGAHIPGAFLPQARFREAHLSHSNLSIATLDSAEFSDARLVAAILSRANLACAMLDGADLSRANLIGADLRGADLTGADLTMVTLAGADLSQADLRGAVTSLLRLDHADGTGCANLDKALVDVDFPLPSGWKRLPTGHVQRIAEK
jgi:hypothetical protein